MLHSANEYWKRPLWPLIGVAIFVCVAGLIGFNHALATIPSPEQAQLRQLAARTGDGFSEASLQSFGETLEPGALALAQRYAPAPQVVLANASSTPTEQSYDSDPGPLPQGFRQLTPEQAAAANANVAFSKAPNPAAAPFKLPAVDDANRARALDCLTMAVYYEAASESAEGQAAVAQVVLNRLRHPLFPKTVCGVVLEGSKLPTGCQFSFTCDGSLARQPSQAGWIQARRVAARALGGYVVKSIGEATHYHTMWVVPYWQPSVVKLTQIGAHIFYRWQGDAGLPSAFRQRYAGMEEQPPAILGFVGEFATTAPPVVTAATAATPATPTPVVAAAASVPEPTLQVADLTAPKGAPVVVGAPTTGPTLTTSSSWFGPAPKTTHRRPPSSW